jgi:hypothetical protein
MLAVALSVQQYVWSGTLNDELLAAFSALDQRHVADSIGSLKSSRVAVCLASCVANLAALDADGPVFLWPTNDFSKMIHADQVAWLKSNAIPNFSIVPQNNVESKITSSRSHIMEASQELHQTLRELIETHGVETMISQLGKVTDEMSITESVEHMKYSIAATVIEDCSQRLAEEFGTFKLISDN